MMRAMPMLITDKNTHTFLAPSLTSWGSGGKGGRAGVKQRGPRKRGARIVAGSPDPGTRRPKKAVDPEQKCLPNV